MEKRVYSIQRQDGTWRPLGTYGLLCWMGVVESVLLSTFGSVVELRRWFEYCNGKHLVVRADGKV
jgi:hypothetical protein